MEPVRQITGRAVPLDRADVDTDQIIPASWLKRIERTGFGEGLFSAWRADPGFVLNRPEYAGARVLIAGPNFGSGSSREHAAWALQDYGFAAVIAPRFADIFRGNSLKIGLLPVELPAETVGKLMAADHRRLRRWRSRSTSSPERCRRRPPASRPASRSTTSPATGC